MNIKIKKYENNLYLPFTILNSFSIIVLKMYYGILKLELKRYFNNI